MRIDRTAFGEITIDGKTYDHDDHSALGRDLETQEEALEAASWYLARRVGGRGEICV